MPNQNAFPTNLEFKDRRRIIYSLLAVTRSFFSLNHDVHPAVPIALLEYFRHPIPSLSPLCAETLVAENGVWHKPQTLSWWYIRLTPVDIKWLRRMKPNCGENEESKYTSNRGPLRMNHVIVCFRLPLLA